MCLGRVGNASRRLGEPPRRILSFCARIRARPQADSILRGVAQSETKPAQEPPAAIEHSAWSPASRAFEPAPPAAKTRPRLGEGHDLPRFLPRAAYLAMAVGQASALTVDFDADLAR